jgi:chromosome segregation ATPase
LELQVQGRDGTDERPAGEEPVVASQESIQPEPATAGPGSAARDLALQAELIAANELVKKLEGSVAEAHGELDRARADLERERGARSADAERFHEALAAIRGTAEQALAAAEEETAKLNVQMDELRRRADVTNAQVAALEEERDAAVAARAAAESDGRAELESLRGRLGQLDRLGEEALQARAEAQRLLDRLGQMADMAEATS